MVRTIKHLLSQETTVYVLCETKCRHRLKYVKDISEPTFTQKATVLCKQQKSAFILTLRQSTKLTCHICNVSIY